MSRFNRRSMLRYSLLGAGAALVQRPAAAASDVSANGNNGPDRYVVDDTSAVADTESGKVVGYIRNDIRIFKGMPYGEVRSPEGRWLRATKPKPWSGVRSSRAAGYVCPPASPAGNDIPLDEVLFRASGNAVTFAGEDCLRINIWSPGLDNRKRNVLFWVHGGGFTDGSSLMSAHYDAANLAQHGNVVVVSINHRLNALGFLDLTAYGERFAESANLGMLDIVDALKWVRTNIANFGGDPAKVMIFGHSGGGAKIATILSMPEAKGLFNRAVIQSPGPLPLSTPEQAAARTATFFKLLEVSPGNVDALYKLPVETLTRAATTILVAANTARDRFDLVNTAADNVWKPVVDGRTVLHQPTRPTEASDVPLLIGTALHESFIALGHGEYLRWSEQQAREVTRGYFGPVGDGVYDVYKQAFPNVTPFDISAMARATGRMRSFSVKIAQGRAAVNSAPSYLYWFQWQSRNLASRARSHHELEIPLLFLNSDSTPQFTGATADARQLSFQLADAWLAFARTGNPKISALPRWTAVGPKTAPAMVFDSNCRIDQGSDLAAIELFWKGRYPTA